AGLTPGAVDEPFGERGVEPVDTPDIKDVVVEEGQPLKFTASFETVPPIEPGEYGTLSVQRRAPRVEAEALAQSRAGAPLREPVEGRAIELGDSVLMDLVRTAAKKGEEPLIVIPGQERQGESQTAKDDTGTTGLGAHTP